MVAARKGLEVVPKRRWVVRQIKHYLDIDRYPLWKRVFFYKVYRPFVLFVYHRLKLPVLMKLDTKGQPCWQELQAVCTSQKLADEMIKGKRWWSYSPVYEDTCGPVETATSGPCVDSGSHTGDMHTRDWQIEAIPIQVSKGVERGIDRLEELLERRA